MARDKNEKRAIYSLTPVAHKRDYYRLVGCFDTEADAKIVLEALESVNVSFHCYKLLPFTKNNYTKKRK